MEFNGQCEVGKIESVLLKHPRDAFKSQAYVDQHWQTYHYPSRPDYEEVLREYEQFVSILKKDVPNIHFLPPSDDTGLDSVFTHDPVLITKRGAIYCEMGKKERRGEPTAVRQFLEQLGIPTLGEITGMGTLEGGDCVWLDEKTLAVGVSYRTNEEAVRQLREMTADFVDEVISVPLPHWNGPDACFHLMSIISPLARDLALVYSRAMPVQFREYLLSRGMRLIDVPDDEFEPTQGCNVLAVAPRKAVMITGNPVTKRRLIEAGVDVVDFKGDELCIKGGGGPTCLTRPILRII